MHSTLAAIAHARGDRDTALEQTRLALQIDQRRVPDAEPTVTDLINLAFLHRQRGELDAAIARYDEAVRIVESLRRRAGLTEAREEYFALLQSPYRGLVRALLSRAADGDGQRAFAVAERARGRGWPTCSPSGDSASVRTMTCSDRCSRTSSGSRTSLPRSTAGSWRACPPSPRPAGDCWPTRSP